MCGCIRRVCGGKVGSREIITVDCPVHECNLSISDTSHVPIVCEKLFCLCLCIAQNTWSVKRRLKSGTSHLRFSTASALTEEVNVVSPALYMPVLEPEDRKIRLQNNRRDKGKKKFFFPWYMMLRSLPVST